MKKISHLPNISYADVRVWEVSEILIIFFPIPIKVLIYYNMDKMPDIFSSPVLWKLYKHLSVQHHQNIDYTFFYLIWSIRYISITSPIWWILIATNISKKCTCHILNNQDLYIRKLTCIRCCDFMFKMISNVNTLLVQFKRNKVLAVHYTIILPTETMNCKWKIFWNV